MKRNGIIAGERTRTGAELDGISPTWIKSRHGVHKLFASRSDTQPLLASDEPVCHSMPLGDPSAMIIISYRRRVRYLSVSCEMRNYSHLDSNQEERPHTAPFLRETRVVAKITPYITGMGATDLYISLPVKCISKLWSAKENMQQKRDSLQRTN